MDSLSCCHLSSSNFLLQILWSESDFELRPLVDGVESSSQCARDRLRYNFLGLRHALSCLILVASSSELELCEIGCRVVTASFFLLFLFGVIIFWELFSVDVRVAGATSGILQLSSSLTAARSLRIRSWTSADTTAKAKKCRHWDKRSVNDGMLNTEKPSLCIKPSWIQTIGPCIWALHSQSL